MPRSAVPLWLEGDEDREFSQSMTTSQAYEPTAVEPPRRRPIAADASPSEAIAEIDRLWYELERLRRPGRHALPG